MKLVTTYQISSIELDLNLINLIKFNFPNQDLIIDVYSFEKFNSDTN
jgi:hypothetical protein